MSEARFSHLRYPAHDLKGPVKDDLRFKSLLHHQEFRDFLNSEETTHKDETVKYICFLYDPESELQFDFPDLNERKDAAASAAGFKRNKQDEWSGDLQNMMAYKDERIVKMILRFLKIFNNPIWTEITTLEHELDKYTRIRWTSDGSEARSLMKTCNDIREQLDKLRKEFYQGDKKLQEIIEMITPENVNRLLQLDHVPSN